MVNASFWMLVRMQKLAPGKTSFRPAAILGANTTPCSSPRISYGKRQLRGTGRAGAIPPWHVFQRIGGWV